MSDGLSFPANWKAGSPKLAESRSVQKATVTLFKPSGKYYTTEEWEVPADAIGPYDMNRSPNFRRISGGPVLVDTQEPWGYPHLLVDR